MNHNFVRKHLVRAPNGLYQQRPKSHPVVIKRVAPQQVRVQPPHVVHIQPSQLPQCNPVAPAAPNSNPGSVESSAVPLETIPPVTSSVSPLQISNVTNSSFNSTDRVTTGALNVSSQSTSSQSETVKQTKQTVLENLVPLNETPEQKEARLKALRLKCVVPDVEEFMNSKTAQCFEGLAFNFPFITCNSDFSAACLWCKQYFLVPVSALNCKIFRHAYYRIGSSEWQLGDLVNPHASKATIDSLKKQNKILGCGGAMYYDGKILRAVGFDT